MKKEPKLLIVGAFPNRGTEIFGGIITTCKTLLESDFTDQFDLILVDSTQRSNPPPGFLTRLLFAGRRFLRYTGELIFRKPEAVLLFTAPGASVLEKGLMAWFARFTGVPTFLFPRGAGLIDAVQESSFQRMLIVPAMRGATHILCQGPAWQRFAIHVLGFSPSHTPVIHNWSATSQLLNIGLNRRPNQETVLLSILFLGWLEKEKGIFELLEACRILSANHSFTLTVAGRGHAEEASRDFVSQNGLNDQVRFIGWVQGQEKLDLLRQADILVLPSWVEGFPNAIIEAMAAKVAVVVTAVGNVPDLLTDRMEALIIPPKNVCALKNALEELLVDGVFRCHLAETGYRFAQENFSTDKGVARLAEEIKAAIKLSNK